MKTINELIIITCCSILGVLYILNYINKPDTFILICFIICWVIVIIGLLLIIWEIIEYLRKAKIKKMQKENKQFIYNPKTKKVYSEIKIPNYIFYSRDKKGRFIKRS